MLGLLRRRVALRPTWRGWLALLLVAVVLVVAAVRVTFPFLAVNDSKPGGVLVVEGFVPDHTIGEAIAEFRRNPYEALLVSGGPIDKGAPFSEFATYAEFGAAVAVKLGGDPARTHAVPSPETRQDRTYGSAVAIRDWLRQRGPMPRAVNVVSLGPHARRSRLMYEAAFGDLADVGIIAVDDQSYDGKRWWMSSSGFRAVTGELIAYVYARLLFRASKVAAPGV
jgi:hypothetical protein